MRPTTTRSCKPCAALNACGRHCRLHRRALPGDWIDLPNVCAGVAAPSDPLAVLIADSGGAVGWALQGFSLLALATSFIGTCTGAFTAACTDCLQYLGVNIPHDVALWHARGPWQISARRAR